MSFTLRALRVPTDFARLVELFSTIESEPTTAEELAHWHESFPPEGLRMKIAATDQDDRLCGYGSVSRRPWSKPGKFSFTVCVDPVSRREGTGAALLTAVERFALGHGATLLATDVRENDEASLAWAKRRGYAIDRHTYESTLNLSSFAPERFAGVLENLEESGIRLFTLDERPDEATIRQLYEFCSQNSMDIPGYDNVERTPYEQWRKWTIDYREARMEALVIATEGERLVAASLAMPIPATGSWYTYHSGVSPDYRGRGLGLGVKLAAVRQARKQGVTYMRTNNDSTNVPMLAVNRKLGYQPAPGIYLLRKQVS